MEDVVVNKGKDLVVTVEKLAFGGPGLARVGGFVVMVDGGIPGQRLRVRVTRKRRNYAEARVFEVLEESPFHVDPFCEHFGVCGGCRWQHLRYEEQVRWKRLHVMEALKPVLGTDVDMIAPTVPSPDLVHYRNKMEFTFSARRWLSQEEIADSSQNYRRDFALGLHVRGFFDRVFDLHQCYLMAPWVEKLVSLVRERTKASGIQAYHIRTHTGFWRFLVVREAKRTGEKLIHLITTEDPAREVLVDRLAQDIHHAFPDVTTFIHSVNRSKAQVAVGERSRVLWGSGRIRECLDDLTLTISAHSFFQTNPKGAERLYRIVEEWAELDGTQKVWDLYCGTGSISLFLARQAKEVLGFEIVEDAIEDAYVNARVNGIANCRFRVGDIRHIVGSEKDPRAMGIPDVVVTDPPRSGMHPDVVHSLLEMAPSRIIAVSCNPSTLARDLALLSSRYVVKCVQPFDLFPHTPHIECVVRLDRAH